MNNKESTVSIWRTQTTAYCNEAPFHPTTLFPESIWPLVSTQANPAYESVRACFHQLGLDQANYNTAEWNPLKGLIKPGDFVLLKPNLVKEIHPRDPEGWQYVLTHGSVIRAVTDYVWLALEGKGKIMVADAPQTDSSFHKIVQLLQLDKLAAFYQSHGVPFELVDLRQEEWESVDDVVVHRRSLSGDPNGYVAFDLGQYSEFFGHHGVGHYYGADYNSAEVNQHHDGSKNEYLISGSAIQCDVFFNLPKLKTHKKAGITVSLKNLVGINGDKNWLPHHTEGFANQGGDEFPMSSTLRQLERYVVKLVHSVATRLPLIGPRLHLIARQAGKQVFGDTEDVIRNGNWYGNDTTWRMCLDLNKLLLYGNSDGSLRVDRLDSQKRYYSLVDGIIGGEGRGPMNPDPKAAGIIIFGTDAAVVDATSAVIMGFEPSKIPIVRQAFRCCHFAISNATWQTIQCISNHIPWNRRLEEIKSVETLQFEPHYGWKGHIEYSE